MKFGSLFSGIGGMDLGLERAGMECRWQIEINPFCRKVLDKHWPKVPKYGDITELTGSELEPVDLIAGGFPCQPVSLAGRRLAQSDERWLWPEYLRIVRVVRPRFVLVENVPGLLVQGFGDVIGGLAESGFDAEWDCIPAASIGAPHIRDRVVLVAYRKSERLAADLLAPGAVVCEWGIPQGWRRNVQLERLGRGLGDTAFPPGPLDEEWARSPQTAGHAPCVEYPLRGKPDGVQCRMDRLRGVGNAVVPQVAEWIGRRIMEAAG